MPPAREVTVVLHMLSVYCELSPRFFVVAFFSLHTFAHFMCMTESHRFTFKISEGVGVFHEKQIAGAFQILFPAIESTCFVYAAVFAICGARSAHRFYNCVYQNSRGNPRVFPSSMHLHATCRMTNILCHCKNPPSKDLFGKLMKQQMGR